MSNKVVFIGPGGTEKLLVVGNRILGFRRDRVKPLGTTQETLLLFLNEKAKKRAQHRSILRDRRERTGLVDTRIDD